LHTYIGMEMKDSDRLTILDQLSKLTLTSDQENIDFAKFKSYNDYAAYQVKKLPEIMLTFLQYDGGDEAMYYMQLTWMEDYWSLRKNMSS
jgi:hypothetical protein